MFESRFVDSLPESSDNVVTNIRKIHLFVRSKNMNDVNKWTSGFQARIFNKSTILVVGFQQLMSYEALTALNTIE